MLYRIIHLTIVNSHSLNLKMRKENKMKRYAIEFKNGDSLEIYADEFFISPNNDNDKIIMFGFNVEEENVFYSNIEHIESITGIK